MWEDDIKGLETQYILHSIRLWTKSQGINKLLVCKDKYSCFLMLAYFL